MALRMTHSLDAIVAGELYVDMIMSGFDVWPQPGREAFAKHYRRDVGGGASITACGLAKLGSRTSVLGLVGSDSGDWIVERLQHNGVGTSLIAFDPAEPTGFTVAATTPEDRAFLTYAGANRDFPAALLEAAASRQLSLARHVHLAFAPALDTAETLFDAIWEGGCTISIDVGWHPEWLQDPRAMQALQKVDVFFPNEVEAHAMTGETDPAKILQKFQAAGVPKVALKLGASGAALLWHGEIWFAGPRAVTPVDTTGAGDCFDAGFLHAMLKGGTPEMSLAAGNICGALSTEGYGGVSGFPTLARLEEEMAQALASVKKDPHA